VLPPPKVKYLPYATSDPSQTYAVRKSSLLSTKWPISIVVKNYIKKLSFPLPKTLPSSIAPSTVIASLLDLRCWKELAFFYKTVYSNSR
jgi:hypothetical protein